MAARKPLAGRVIAVPETRELERLSGMLEQKGATTLRYPLVGVREVITVESGKAITYRPDFKIVKWVARPSDL